MLHEIPFDDSSAWDEAISACSQSDFHHSNGYHRLARENGEGEPTLLVWQNGGRRIALPLLLRPVNAVLGLGDAHAELRDSTSVYGYGGPVFSGELDEATAGDWQSSLQVWAQRRHVVSLFSRLHPLWDTTRLLHGLGDVTSRGSTVSIDLAKPPAEQRAAYRDDHKRAVNKLRRTGYSVAIAQDPRISLDRFVEIYLSTMERVGSTEYYRFDRDYFERLLQCCPGVFHLFNVWHEDSIAASGLFSLYRGIVQFHLSGTDAAHLKNAPSKLMIDEVRLWANAQGATIFHLGGGVGSERDSLFQFKAGFSDRQHEFKIWTWICDTDAAAELLWRKRHWHAQRGEMLPSGPFFPPYRAVGVPRGNSL